MKRPLRMLFILILLFLLLEIGITGGRAVSGYSLNWWTVDCGGGESQGGSYALNGTIGQVDAGTLLGGSFTLASGFWSAVPSAPIVPEYRVLLPLLKK